MRAQTVEDNIHAQAAAEGLEYRAQGRDHGSTFNMHRLLHFAKEHGKQAALNDRLYHANYAKKRSVFNDAERLRELASAVGLAAAAAGDVFADTSA
ncbi:DsbA family protein [Streptomyces sp. NPDC005811]|uniref:DsbA family oxidoreductase n=1 Tax=Streptomyces sp. NPDC005811 TaxID=3154565 RepID=UPI0033D4946E